MDRPARPPPSRQSYLNIPSLISAAEVTGADALDLGASTGGFTACPLKPRAPRVVAVDGRYWPLAWPPCNDPPPTAMAPTNQRPLQPADHPYPPTTLPSDVASTRWPSG